MRKIRIMEHISLDGVIENDEDYAYDGWTALYRSPAGREMIIEAQGENFDLLLGRRTYDIWANYWPLADNSPMADSLNAATKYVATHRPESLVWGPVKPLGMDVTESVRSIKSEDGPDLILWGSSTLTSVLIGEGLVDEIVLIVYPVLLGRGKRFFSESISARQFEHVSTKATTTGVLLNTYRYMGPLIT